MAFSYYCNPCERRSIESKSDGWCCECEEGLCDRCLQDHKAIKITQRHHVVKVTSQDIVENYHLLSIPNCELHPELKEDLLCKDHDVVCCNGCLVTDHKACTNVVPLDVAAKGVKNSDVFQAIKGGMVVIKKVSNNIIEERQASKEELNRQELRIRKEIANIKSRFMEHINNLEKSLLSELAEIPKENAVEIEKEKREIGTIEREIEADENALKFVAENGSESQIFSFLRKLKKKQFEVKEKMEKIPPTSRVTITLEESSHQIEAINSLGFLSVRYDSVTKSEANAYQRQREICPLLKVAKEMEINPTQFMKEEKTYEDLVFYVFDYAVTEDNELLVIGNVNTRNGREYYSSSQLVKYHVDMKFIKSWTFNFRCDGTRNTSMTCVPKSEQVVISHGTGLHFVNSKTMTEMWPSVCLTTGGGILDLTANIKHIFVLTNHRFIQVCDLIGRQLKTINFGSDNNYTSITLQPNGNFIGYEKNAIASVEPDGSNIFLYGRCQNAVTVDRNGNIYMAGENGIDMMNHHEQHVQRVFTFPDEKKQVVGIESYNDNKTVCVLYKSKHNKQIKWWGNVIDTYSYSLQVLTAST